MLTRDSVVWWIGLAVAIVGQLIVVGKPPTEWTYLEWLQIISFALAWVVGKLASSPLAGAPKDDVVSRPKVPSWLLVLVLVPLVAACGPTTKPTLVKVDTGIYQGVKALHETAVVLGRSQVITPQQELKLQEAILPVTILGEQATRVLAAWTSGPTPPELQRLVAEMAQLTRKIIEILPGESKGKTTLLEAVAFVQQAIATALIITGGTT